MRTTTARFLTLVLGSALTEAATYGKLYTYDTDKVSRSINQDVYNPSLARLVLERRMKPSQSSSLGTLDENTVDLIEGLGGDQTYLFGDEEDRKSQRRLLVICESGNIREGTKNASDQGNSISFPTVSSDLIEDEFIYSLLDPDSGSLANSRVCSTEHGSPSASTTGSANFLDTQECLGGHSIFNGVVNALSSAAVRDFLYVSVNAWIGQEGRIGILKVWSAENTANTAIADAFVRYFQHDVKSRTAKFDAAALLLHPGPFSKPSRLSGSQVEETAQPARRHVSRDGLPIHRSNRDFSTKSLPLCHASNSSCESATGHCSNHGYCYRKYKSTDAAVNDDCYACKCVTTVVQNSDGSVKKIDWGGAACEKKDVSSPFFLLASISILLVLAIGGGIGMLFSVGQEQLPSVISAGVGGSKDSR